MSTADLSVLNPSIFASRKPSKQAPGESVMTHQEMMTVKWMINPDQNQHPKWNWIMMMEQIQVHHLNLHNLLIHHNLKQN